MNCAHAINVNTQPYSNARRPVVMSNRPNFERFSGSTAPSQQRKGFTRLHSNDRKIYEKLVDIVEAKPGTYTAGEVRSMIDGMLNGKMHAEARTVDQQPFPDHPL